jgi:long-chain acyl-CoA synthetase
MAGGVSTVSVSGIGASSAGAAGTGGLAFGGAFIPRSELEARAAQGAAALEALGVGEGDVVAVMLYNRPEWLELMLACRRLGAYWCPINWHFKADEARHILADSGAKLLVAEPGLYAGERVVHDWPALRARHLPREGSARAPRLGMFYTSGTTGRPKGVRRLPPAPADAPRLAELAAQAWRIALGFEPGARALLSAPLYHSAPNSYALQAILHDCALWLEPKFDAERTLELIARERITHAYMVPTMFARLLKLPQAVRARHDVSSMRFVISMGSPCAPEVKRAMIDWWGPVIHESYAASEFGLVTFITGAEALERPGSAGRALPAAAVKILDRAGRELPAGEVGLIYARNRAYPDFTYTNNDAARRQIEREGLSTLGDMGYLDADGYLYVCDRDADMVISGGVNIYPAEIEAALVTMPGVADCAVFGIPDAEFGEALAAAVQPQPGARLEAAAVQAWLRERLAGYKVPRVVEFMESLPREDSGKIFKRRLKQPWWEGSGRRI